MIETKQLTARHTSNDSLILFVHEFLRQEGWGCTPLPIRLKIRNQKRGEKQENGSQHWRDEASPL